MSAYVKRMLEEQRGATLVEFALVTPVLILVLVASLDFARALNAYVTVTNASREGARYAIVHPLASDSSIEAFVATRIVPLDPAALNVTAIYAQSPVAPWRDFAEWTSLAPSEWTVTVRVTYRWDAATWMVGRFFSAASGSRTFDVSSVVGAMQ
jgi:Flp pilus assembly protein TadG